jgi:hypothetical protein
MCCWLWERVVFSSPWPSSFLSGCAGRCAALKHSQHTPWGLCKVKHRSSKLKEQLVDVAPGPVLTRLERLNDGMIGGVEMPGGVLVLRIVTAADVPTGETEAQVHPAISNFQTVLTSIGAWRDLAYLVEVATVVCHRFQFSFFDAPGCSRLFSHIQPGVEDDAIGVGRECSSKISFGGCPPRGKRPVAWSMQHLLIIFGRRRLFPTRPCQTEQN